MSRLEILKASLEKKKSEFDTRLADHFASVAEANGQPLNDKRNGAATLKRWEKQNDALRNKKKSIEKTEAAIEREESKIASVNYANDFIPPQILELVQQGVLTQWRKHPTTFFVVGVDKARIVWDEDKKVVAHRYAREVTDPEMRKKFAAVYNGLHIILNVAASTENKP
jgi:hypothetical protein